MKSLYAFSVMAAKQKHDGMSTDVNSRALAGVAENEQEAKSIALEYCYKTYPYSEGYHSHAVSVFFIPDVLIEMAGR